MQWWQLPSLAPDEARAQADICESDGRPGTARVDPRISGAQDIVGVPFVGSYRLSGSRRRVHRSIAAIVHAIDKFLRVVPMRDGTGALSRQKLASAGICRCSGSRNATSGLAQRASRNTRTVVAKPSGLSKCTMWPPSSVTNEL